MRYFENPAGEAVSLVVPVRQVEAGSGYFELGQLAAYLQVAILNISTATPIIDSSKVGVKVPVTGTGATVDVAVGDGLTVVDGVAVAEGVGERVWDGVASNAGSSPA